MPVPNTTHRTVHILSSDSNSDTFFKFEDISDVNTCRSTLIPWNASDNLADLVLTVTPSDTQSPTSQSRQLGPVKDLPFVGFYDWDPVDLPEGVYVVHATASAASSPPQQISVTSSPFVINDSGDVSCLEGISSGTIIPTSSSNSGTTSTTSSSLGATVTQSTTASTTNSANTATRSIFTGSPSIATTSTSTSGPSATSKITSTSSSPESTRSLSSVPSPSSLSSPVSPPTQTNVSISNNTSSHRPVGIIVGSVVGGVFLAVILLYGIRILWPSLLQFRTRDSGMLAVVTDRNTLPRSDRSIIPFPNRQFPIGDLIPEKLRIRPQQTRESTSQASPAHPIVPLLPDNHSSPSASVIPQERRSNESIRNLVHRLNEALSRLPPHATTTDEDQASNPSSAPPAYMSMV